MVRFVEVFPDEQIVSALRRQLGWTHFEEIIYLDDPLRREFYAEMCRIERWSTRTLQAKINGTGSNDRLGNRDQGIESRASLRETVAEDPVLQ